MNNRTKIIIFMVVILLLGLLWFGSSRAPETPAEPSKAASSSPPVPVMVNVAHPTVVAAPVVSPVVVSNNPSPSISTTKPVAPAFYDNDPDKIKAAKSMVTDGFYTSMMRHRLDTGRYPASLDDLVINTSGETGWHGPYVDQGALPLDPWGQPYQYQFPGTHNPRGYDLWSTGPSGESGNSDNIGNW